MQNTGNLPLSVDSLSLDDRGCQARTMLIENCHTFILKPGEQHWLHIGFHTDFSIAKLKKKLVLTSKQGVIQTYFIELNMPMEYMGIASDHMALENSDMW